MKTSKKIKKADVKEIVIGKNFVRILGYKKEVLDEVPSLSAFEAKIIVDGILDQMDNSDLDFVDFQVFDCSDVPDRELTKEQNEACDKAFREIEE